MAIRETFTPSIPRGVYSLKLKQPNVNSDFSGRKTVMQEK